MKVLLAVGIVLVLTACTTMDIEPQKFRGPSGNDAYSMRCSGMGRTLDACYQKAGELCPNGYTIIDRASGTVAVPTTGGGVIAAPQHNLAIECK